MTNTRIIQLRLRRRPASWTVLLLVSACTATSYAAGTTPAPEVSELAREVAGRGWILFTAKTPQGDYDLFVSRPDGSAKRNLTHTPAWNEFGGRISPDSKHILYRRQKVAAVTSFNAYNNQGEA